MNGSTITNAILTDFKLDLDKVNYDYKMKHQIPWSIQFIDGLMIVTVYQLKKYLSNSILGFDNYFFIWINWLIYISFY